MYDLCITNLATFRALQGTMLALDLRDKMVLKVEALETGAGHEGNAFIVPVLPQPILIRPSLVILQKLRS